VRAPAGGQQFEAVPGDTGSGGQVDGAEVRKTLAEQVFQRHVEGGENRYAQERLPVQRLGAGGPPGVPSQLVVRVAPATDDDRRSRWHLLGAQQRTLLDPVPGYLISHDGTPGVIGPRVRCADSPETTLERHF
jgi:hypothetical protein